MDKRIVVLCRGHSASRLISQTLQESDVFMGSHLNPSYDKQPYDVMRIMAKRCLNSVLKHNNGMVSIKGIDIDTRKFLNEHYNVYTKDMRGHELAGWKLPETFFITPFLFQKCPDYYYIYWTRSISRQNEHARGNYNDNILNDNGYLGDTDNTNSYNVSWLIHTRIMDACVEKYKPKNFLHIRMEDFILNNEEIIEKISDWFGHKIVCNIPLIKDVVKQNDHYNLSDPSLIKPMMKLGYIKDSSKVVINPKPFVRKSRV